MKPPHAWHVMIAAALVGVGVIGVLVVAHRSAVRDHIEAWRFQRTRQTETITPDPASKGQPAVLVGEGYGKKSSRFELGKVLSLLGNQSGRPVIYDPEDRPRSREHSPLPAGIWWTEEPLPADYWATPAVEIKAATADLAMSILRANGWRVLEQRFPMRAYIVIRDPAATIEEGPVMWVGE